MEMKFTVEELETIANDFLKETFDMELEIPILISERMKSTYGYFKAVRNQKTPIEIRISANLLRYYTEEEILGTLKHECVHYALYMLGKPHRDGDPYFEQTLQAFGIPATGTKAYRGKAHKYECSKCKASFTRKVKRNMSKYISVCCETKIDYVGEVLVRVEE